MKLLNWKSCAIFIIGFTCYVECSNILALVPFPGQSHWLWIDHFLTELVKRGHHVTAINNYPSKNPHENLTEIRLDVFNIPYYFPKEEILGQKFDNVWDNLFLYFQVGLKTTTHALQQKNVQDFIDNDNQHFDLIIAEQFFQESFLMFSHKYNAPIVTIGTIGYSDFMDRAMGLLTPWSFVPHVGLHYTDNMTFFERTFNTILSIFDMAVRKFWYLPIQQELAEKHFKSIEEKSGKLPTVAEMEKRISMMLINSHRSINPPRPGMPSLINVGGAHIKPPKPLPTDIKKFLDDATDGVILFSFGSYMVSSDLNSEVLNIFFETFRNLKQRILWKFEDENMNNLPKNVMVRQWLPQSDILAHKNVILFITHGGMFGTQEGLYRGVPMLVIPFYGDQRRNGLKCEIAGVAKLLKFDQITNSTLKINLNELLYNKKYLNRAREISSIFSDNPIQPLDEAIFWIEYVIRHKGAKHLKSAAVNMPWYSYLLFDVFGFFIFIFLIINFILYKFIRILFGKNKSNNNNNNYNKKKN